MRYGDAAAFRQALEQRLRARAAGDGARLARDRKRVAFDRLLARLNEVAPGDWLLKGGFALDLRLADRARATRDVDLDWQADEEKLAETLIEAAGVSGDDFFTFGIERTGMAPERLGGSHRSRVTASLAGRPFETFLLDVGLRSSLVDERDTLTTNDLLSFAEIEPVEVPAVPLERHIAEKLHAYTRRYGDDRPSSRVKDLIDLVLMSELASFEYGRLRDAIARTFGERETHELPTSLPAPPADWAQPYRVLAGEVGLDAGLASGHRDAAAFLDPVLADVPDLDLWDERAMKWRRRR
ncbi:Nucleotidyl transferase [Gaiella occulta]|uniref:Nucleotidyl transferase n=1 Tax=Gaiella occulta TaxID=1002870 RepID=A0A7M2YXF4_9ACTN|nr:nucleotidyl transferase AbiEii/AbiGii toxin family protein [Gaiella occulta]RDI74410.1 Nucleotidyl transferase [Gaiella occulta]